MADARLSAKTGHVPACFGDLVIFRPAHVAATGAAFHELFTPKLVTVLREGYGLARLRADARAGLLAIVLRRFVDQARRHHVRVFNAGAVRPVRRVLIQQGLRPPSVRYAQSVAQARAAAARSPEHAGT
jgi:hypothetical protein